MNPLETTRSGAWARTASASARFHAERSPPLTRGTAKVGIPAAVARAIPPQSGTSEPTAAISRSSSPPCTASMTAWRFVPEPETRTTVRMTASLLRVLRLSSPGPGRRPDRVVDHEHVITRPQPRH